MPGQTILRFRRGVLLIRLKAPPIIRIGGGPEGINAPLTLEAFVDALRDGLPECTVREHPLFEALNQRGYLERTDPPDNLLPERFRRQTAYLGRMCRSDTTPDHALLSRLQEARVWVVGLGGCGSNITYSLFSYGVGHIVGIDYARVDGSDLNRQCYRPQDIGELKPNALRDHLSTLGRIANFSSVIQRVATSAHLDRIWETEGPCDAIVLTADEPPLALRLMVNEWCIAHDVPYMFFGTQETASAIGPLVVPGQTGCFGCWLAQQRQLHPGFADELDEKSTSESLEGYGFPSSLGPAWIASALITEDLVRYLLFGVKTPLRLLGRCLTWHIDEITPRSENWSQHPECMHACANVVPRRVSK